MAPTLPTELIKHILEFVYEDVRALDSCISCKLSSDFDGTNVPHFFAPFLLVSRMFHAVALPITIRHLLSYPLAYTTITRIPDARRLAPLGCHVKSLAVKLPEDRLNPIHLILRCCTQLKALHVWHLPLRIDLLPCTITTLVLGTFQRPQKWSNLDGDRVTQLTAALPNLKNLGLTVVSIRGPPVEAGWQLERLSVAKASTHSAEQILAWVKGSAETLVELRFSAQQAYSQTFSTLPSTVMAQVGHPLPALRGLELGEDDWLPAGSEATNSNMLPALEHLTMSIGDGGAAGLLKTSRTLKVVKLLISYEAEVVSSGSPSIADLETFIRTHQNLELLSVDLADEQIPVAGWSDTLEALCAERGVHFCTNDPAYGVNGGIWYGPPVQSHHGQVWQDQCWIFVDEYDEECRCSQCDWEGLEQSWSSGSNSDTTGVGSSGISEDLDFDAEDDEMWAHQWSEEKREAMGLVAKLEESNQGDDADVAEDEPTDAAEHEQSADLTPSFSAHGLAAITLSHSIA